MHRTPEKYGKGGPALPAEEKASFVETGLQDPGDGLAQGVQTVTGKIDVFQGVGR